ncbi:hypothetical protein BDV59DRAFT_169933 [Aspergillus ambiguus]|uniref:uncharacterized protein n=1 Tax=Aspergillus ambiguus TaxID=176160 RepID=UPI003CCE1843
MAMYLAYDSARLRLLLRILDQEIPSESSQMQVRFLVFCAWPITMWMTGMLLRAVGFPYRSIHRRMHSDLHRIAIGHFKDPGTKVQVLLLTYEDGIWE